MVLTVHESVSISLGRSREFVRVFGQMTASGLFKFLAVRFGDVRHFVLPFIE